MPTVQEVIKDQDFLGLPDTEKRKVLRTIDPDYAGLPDMEQAKVLVRLLPEPEKPMIDEDIRQHFGLIIDESKEPNPADSLWRSFEKKQEAEKAEKFAHKAKPFEPSWEEVSNFALQNTIAGMMARQKTPDIELEAKMADLPLVKRWAMQLETTTVDLPYYLMGGVLGAGGGVVGAVGGAFALHAGLRRVLIDKYDMGEVKNVTDFVDRTNVAIYETLKGYALGVSVSKAGAVAKTIGLPALTTEIPTMVTVGAMLEGRLPNKEDFVDASAVLITLHTAAKTIRYANTTKKVIEAKLKNKYVDEDLHPLDVIEEVKIDAAKAEEYIKVTEEELYDGINKRYDEIVEKKNPAPEEIIEKKVIEESIDNSDKLAEMVGVTIEKIKEKEPLPAEVAKPEVKPTITEEPLAKVAEPEVIPTEQIPDYQIMSLRVKPLKTIEDVRQTFEKGKLNYIDKIGKRSYSYEEIKDKYTPETWEQMKEAKITEKDNIITVKTKPEKIWDEKKQEYVKKEQFMTFERVLKVPEREGVKFLGEKIPKGKKPSAIYQGSRFLEELAKEDPEFKENPFFVFKKGDPFSDYLVFTLKNRQYKILPKVISGMLPELIETKGIKDGQTFRLSSLYLEGKRPEIFLVEKGAEKGIQFDDMTDSDLGFIKLGREAEENPNLKQIKNRDIGKWEFIKVELHIADKYPVLKPIIEKGIDTELDVYHVIRQQAERLTTLFDKYEKPSIIQRLRGRKESGLLDLADWREGKKPTPEFMKGIVEETGKFFDEYRNKVINSKIDKILTELTPKQKEVYDYVKANNLNLETVTFEDVKGKVKYAREQSLEALKVLQEDMAEVREWGKNPLEYFPRSFKGGYKFLNENGGIVASGETLKQTKLRLKEYLTENPSEKGKTFYGTLNLIEMLELRDLLSEGAKTNPFMFLGTLLSRKQYGILLGKTEQLVKQEVLNATGIKVDADVNLKGIARPLPKTKFVGHLLQRTTELKGDVQDPYRVMMSYMIAMERKLAFDKLRLEVNKDIEKLPPDMPNAKQFLTKMLDNTTGRYDKVNDFVDESLKRFARTKIAKALQIDEPLQTKPFIVSRIIQKAMTAEAYLKMGYAPVKAVINFTSGLAKGMIAQSPTYSDFLKQPLYRARGIKWLRTPEGKKTMAEIGHRIGLEQPFTQTGRESYTKATRNIFKPLGMFNTAEFVIRPWDAATMIMKMMDEGMTLEQAKIEAVNVVRLAQNLYTTANTPVVITNPVFKQAYQFKQYLNSEFRFMNSLTPQQWSMYIPYIFSMAGTRGLWLIGRSLLYATGLSFILNGTINEIDEEMEELNRKYPKLHRGLIGVVTNEDWSAPSTWQIPIRPEDYAGLVLMDTIRTAQMTNKYLKNNGWTDEEIATYWQSVAPTAYTFYKGVQIYLGGAIKQGSKTMYKATDRDEAIHNLLGAKSVTQSQQQDSARYMFRKAEEHRRLQAVAYDKFFNAETKKEAIKLLDQMVKDGLIPYNLKTGRPDYSGLIASGKSRQLTQEERAFKGLPLKEKINIINMRMMKGSSSRLFGITESFASLMSPSEASAEEIPTIANKPSEQKVIRYNKKGERYAD